MCHADVGIRHVWRGKALVELQRLFAPHPVNEHRALVEGEIILVAGVESPTKRDFVLVGAGDTDAILLSIDDYVSAVVTRTGILEARRERLNISLFVLEVMSQNDRGLASNCDGNFRQHQLIYVNKRLENSRRDLTYKAVTIKYLLSILCRHWAFKMCPICKMGCCVVASMDHNSQ